MSLWTITQAAINGVLAGGVYALVAVGITVIFGVMRMVNFASGAYLAAGMYMGYLAYMITGWNTYLLIPLTAVFCVLLALLSYKICVQPVLGKGNSTSALMVTVGLSFAMQNLLNIVFGTDPVSIPSEISSSSFRIGSFAVGLPRFIAFVAAILLVLIVYLFVNKTKFGREMRATSENKEVAEMLGINTKRVFSLSWTIGITLIGIGGLLVTPIYYIQPTAGVPFRTTPIVAIVLGGLGDIRGALISGVFLGVIEALVSLLVASDLGQLGIFLAYLIVLFIKPQGLFGRGERVA